MSDGQSQAAKQISTAVGPQSQTDIAVQHSIGMVEGVAYLEGRQALTNFAGGPIDKWKFTAKCLSPECYNAKEHIGEEIILKHYYVTTIPQLHEESGEMRPAVYVVLATPDNRCYGIWSPFVARDLGRMIEALGTNDFGAEGIPVKIISTDTGKRTFYSLVPA